MERFYREDGKVLDIGLIVTNKENNKLRKNHIFLNLSSLPLSDTEENEHIFKKVAFRLGDELVIDSIEIHNIEKYGIGFNAYNTLYLQLREGHHFAKVLIEEMIRRAETINVDVEFYYYRSEVNEKIRKMREVFRYYFGWVLIEYRHKLKLDSYPAEILEMARYLPLPTIETSSSIDPELTEEIKKIVPDLFSSDEFELYTVNYHRFLQDLTVTMRHKNTGTCIAVHDAHVPKAYKLFIEKYKDKVEEVARAIDRDYECPECEKSALEWAEMLINPEKRKKQAIEDAELYAKIFSGIHSLA